MHTSCQSTVRTQMEAINVTMETRGGNTSRLDRKLPRAMPELDGNRKSFLTGLCKLTRLLGQSVVDVAPCCSFGRCCGVGCKPALACGADQIASRFSLFAVEMLLGLSSDECRNVRMFCT